MKVFLPLLMTRSAPGPVTCQVGETGASPSTWMSISPWTVDWARMTGKKGTVREMEGLTPGETLLLIRWVSPRHQGSGQMKVRPGLPGAVEIFGEVTLQAVLEDTGNAAGCPGRAVMEGDVYRPQVGG